MSSPGAMRRLFGALTNLMRRCRPKQTRLAVMIDCDGVSPKYADRVLAHIPSLGRICILRAYGNFNAKSAHAWVKLARNRGSMARHLPTLLPGKNATDIALTIDAIDILSTRRVDAFVLIASDTDFAPLAYRICQPDRRYWVSENKIAVRDAHLLSEVRISASTIADLLSSCWVCSIAEKKSSFDN
jgi:predicted nuclease of predicted toxin-antitoxin system